MNAADWTTTFSGWELVCAGIIGLFTTAAGVYLGVAAERRVAESKAKSLAIFEAKQLVDETVRAALSNAPTRSPETLPILWPYSARVMEIVAQLRIVDPELPRWLRGELSPIIRAAGDRRAGKEAGITEPELSEMGRLIEDELDRTIGNYSGRRHNGWYGLNTKEVLPRRSRTPEHVEPRRSLGTRIRNAYDALNGR